MIEILVGLSILQFAVIAYLLITKSAAFNNLLGKPYEYLQEDELCICGEPLKDCPDAYEHMTHGV